MKLRIENDRLVFRLGEEEQHYLNKKKELTLSAPLPGRSLVFILRLDSTTDAIEIIEEKEDIIVLMPQYYMDQWDDVKVGFEETISFSKDRSLTVIIEKDLKRSKKRNTKD
jgi:hypothetical protein